MESCSNVLSYAKIRASYGANGNVSGVLDANGNVVTGLDYYTVQGSYGIMKDKDGKIVPNYNGKVPLMINDLPNPHHEMGKIVHIRDRFRYWFSE